MFAHEAEIIGSTKVRHLRSYGDGVKFIGTTGCITCIGIYFEIAGNRVFCVHVDAWMSDDTHAPALDTDTETGNEQYQEIKVQFRRKLHDHAMNHGWDRSDVDKDTIRLASPNPEVLGRAIQHGLMEYLRLDKYPRTEVAHGFVIAPGGRTKKNGLTGLFCYRTAVLRANLFRSTRRLPVSSR